MRLLLFALLLTTAAAAQPGWRALPDADGASLSFDVLYALGDDLSLPLTDVEGNPVEQEEIGIFASAFVIGARVPVSARVTLVGELPFAYYGIDYPEPVMDVVGVEDSGDLGAGNPYVGAEVRLRPDLALSAGIRVPLADEGNRLGASGWQGGIVAETERFEAYLPDTFTASISVVATPALTEQVRARIRLEPAILVPTGDNTDSEADLAMGAFLGLDAVVGSTTLSGGVLSRRTLTNGRFGDLRDIGVFEADATATLGVTVNLGTIRPGLDLRVPLYDTTFGQDATVAVRVDVPLG